MKKGSKLNWMQFDKKFLLSMPGVECTEINNNFHRISYHGTEIGQIQYSTGRQENKWFAYKSGNYYGPYLTPEEAISCLLTLYK